jgi:hypothetical protein
VLSLRASDQWAKGKADTMTITVNVPFNINEGISGAWYEPAHDGEGWFVQLLEDDLAVVYWFTYTPPGTHHEQAWIGALGRVEGNQIIVEEADTITTEGTPFGAEFNKNEIVPTPWGSFTMTFEDCNTGSITYNSSQTGYGSGTLQLARLTNIAGLSCTDGTSDDDTDETYTGQVIPATSSAWYDPSHDGEGWFVEILNVTTAAVIWFTYDPEGNQAWMLGIGTIKSDRVEIELEQTSGTDFGQTFNKDDVIRAPWGNAVFEFTDCDSGNMRYESIVPGYGSGQLALKRLTYLKGLGCTSD